MPFNINGKAWKGVSCDGQLPFYRFEAKPVDGCIIDLKRVSMGRYLVE